VGTLTFNQLEADFELLDDWEDRYRYVIELGRTLPAFSEADRTDATKVRGCVSQVWLKSLLREEDGRTVLRFTGDSDALIVRGLIAILRILFDGEEVSKILATDAGEKLARLGLHAHLTPQRSNGLAAMVRRIKSDAVTAPAA
jgi:cysteine desulfuration protein SufE